jgi:wyosine [tRNA(Phe)-imidazoG37] synthetase (radical SAM superfamily)
MQGDFYDRFEVDDDQRVIRDIAISGNGEPTSLKNFARAVDLIGATVAKVKIPGKHKFILITNGSLIHQQNVQQGLKKLNNYQGEIWFKVDSATDKGRKSINNAATTGTQLIENLITAARLCPTWLQTCLLSINGKDFPDSERKAYLQLLKDVQKQAKLEGVLLYTLARPSLQPEADRLAKLPEDKLNGFAEEIRKLGLIVKVSA